MGIPRLRRACVAAFAAAGVAGVVAAGSCTSTTSRPPAGTVRGDTVPATARIPSAPVPGDDPQLFANGPLPSPPAQPGAPGELIGFTAAEAPDAARGFRFAYHSRSVDDRDITVTGVILVPDHPAPGAPLITWAHPTTGTADDCTISARGTFDLPERDALVARGYTVVATDYPGLGTTDPHPYLVGVAEGRSVLDAARAARQVPTSPATDASPVIVWGFSQGGHAAAFAAEIAPDYAPDVPIVGVIIAAPVSNVERFVARAQRADDQFGVLLTVVSGMRAAHPELDLATVVTPPVLDELDQLERLCIGAVNEHFDRPISSMLLTSPLDQPDFRRHIDENLVAQRGISWPVLVVQGALDDIVDPADTAAMVDRYCAAGTTVEYVVKPDLKHGVIAADPYLDWIDDRMAGRPAVDSCTTVTTVTTGPSVTPVGGTSLPR